jgi:hypothetical protein
LALLPASRALARLSDVRHLVYNNVREVLQLKPGRFGDVRCNEYDERPLSWAVLLK